MSSTSGLGSDGMRLRTDHDAVWREKGKHGVAGGFESFPGLGFEVEELGFEGRGTRRWWCGHCVERLYEGYFDWNGLVKRRNMVNSDEECFARVACVE